MENTMTWTAIRTDRARSAAHGGAILGFCATSGVPGATKQRAMVPATGFVPATYVADQESNPPREESG